MRREFIVLIVIKAVAVDAVVPAFALCCLFNIISFSVCVGVRVGLGWCAWPLGSSKKTMHKRRVSKLRSDRFFLRGERPPRRSSRVGLFKVVCIPPTVAYIMGKKVSPSIYKNIFRFDYHEATMEFRALGR